METRFRTGRVRVYRSLPPLICFSGQRPNQDAKAEAFRKRERSGPTSHRMVWAVMPITPAAPTTRLTVRRRAAVEVAVPRVGPLYGRAPLIGNTGDVGRHVQRSAGSSALQSGLG